MTTSDDPQPIAFVIMPFDDEFDDLYNDFLYETLTDLGFAVSRADDLQNAQNIMKDILTGLSESDLIVADLTGLNPNVHYELGLAHALNKPVIMLTQDIGTLPFDLQSYRVIGYTPRFSDVARAKEQLTTMAKGLTSGEVSFGNPVSDFLFAANPVYRLPVTAGNDRTDTDSEELGILDHAFEFEEGAADLTEIIADIGDGFRQRSVSLQALSNEMAKVHQRGNQAKARDRIIAVRRVAAEMEEYARFLADKNERYGVHLNRAQSSLEELVKAQDVSDPEARKQLETLLASLDENESTVEGFRSIVGETANTVQSMPGVEKNLIRSRNELSKQFRYLEENAQQTISMVSRARQIGNDKLNGLQPR